MNCGFGKNTSIYQPVSKFQKFFRLSCFVLFCLVLRFSFSRVSPKEERGRTQNDFDSCFTGFQSGPVRDLFATCDFQSGPVRDLYGSCMELVRVLKGNRKQQKARIRVQIGEFLQNTNKNQESGKILACMFEKCEKIRNFPQFQSLLN